eukprot:TRINITY_DN931_c0_g1_i1.p1 TRINITY_DN931_c0_g1~~TRINITY_DN931_c0_g1_i1.p1  ORF type:complete len:632 (+),score=203.35 TRINITY_DN931_c0_g1_i1:1382-3277(+)
MIMLAIFPPYRCTSSNACLHALGWCLFADSVLGYLVLRDVKSPFLVASILRVFLAFFTLIGPGCVVLIIIASLIFRVSWPVNKRSVRQIVTGYEHFVHAIQEANEIMEKISRTKPVFQRCDEIALMIQTLNTYYTQAKGEEHPLTTTLQVRMEQLIVEYNRYKNLTILPNPGLEQNLDKLKEKADERERLLILMRPEKRSLLLRLFALRLFLGTRKLVFARRLESEYAAFRKVESTEDVHVDLSKIGEGGNTVGIVVDDVDALDEHGQKPPHIVTAISPPISISLPDEGREWGGHGERRKLVDVERGMELGGRGALGEELGRGIGGLLVPTQSSDDTTSFLDVSEFDDTKSMLSDIDSDQFGELADDDDDDDDNDDDDGGGTSNDDEDSDGTSATAYKRPPAISVGSFSGLDTYSSGETPMSTDASSSFGLSGAFLPLSPMTPSVQQLLVPDETDRRRTTPSGRGIQTVDEDEEDEDEDEDDDRVSSSRNGMDVLGFDSVDENGSDGVQISIPVSQEDDLLLSTQQKPLEEVASRLTKDELAKRVPKEPQDLYPFAKKFFKKRDAFSQDVCKVILKVILRRADNVIRSFEDELRAEMGEDYSITKDDVKSGLMKRMYKLRKETVRHIKEKK